MSKPRLIVAILLTIFMLPGAGQGIVGRKARGAVFGGITTLVLIAFVVHLAQLVFAQINTQAMGTDLGNLWAFSTGVSQDIFGQNALVIKTYIFLLGTCYIAAVTDLFWLYFEDQE